MTARWRVTAPAAGEDSETRKQQAMNDAGIVQ